MSTDLGPADKSKTKPTKVKLLTSRTNGDFALNAGAEITVPEWEAQRMFATGQAELCEDKR